MRGDASVQQAIINAARARGENPAFALAVAQRESDFDPRAHSSKTIYGIYQMRGDLRAKYGSGDSSDPAEQANGWFNSLGDIRSQMRRVLGREPTDQEVYLGHHYGATRAARTLLMDPSTPVETIFTPQEMSINPHFARAGTIGNLNASVMGDIDKRMARFGGDAGATPPPAEPADLSSFGTPVQVASLGDAPSIPQADVKHSDSPPTAPDLSSFGTPVEQFQPSVQAAASAPADLAQFGTPVS